MPFNQSCQSLKEWNCNGIMQKQQAEIMSL